jgi:Acetyltransferase (GNAT) family
VIRLILLDNVQTGEPIEAQLVSLDLSHIADYEQHWLPLLNASQAEDVQAFDWRVKRAWAVATTGREAYAILVDGRVQGMILIEVARHRSRSESRGRLVYVESLAVAPWNRRSLGRLRLFKGVGKALLLYARQRSFELGYRGAVGLESLSGSVGFYERLGLMRLDPELDDIVNEADDLPYFEHMPLRQERDPDDE